MDKYLLTIYYMLDSKNKIRTHDSLGAALQREPHKTHVRFHLCGERQHLAVRGGLAWSRRSGKEFLKRFS